MHSLLQSRDENGVVAVFSVAGFDWCESQNGYRVADAGLKESKRRPGEIFDKVYGSCRKDAAVQVTCE